MAEGLVQKTCELPEKMTTNIAISDALLRKACELSGLTNKKAVATQALIEYVQKRQQVKIVDLFGTIEYDEHYDYKVQRQVI